MATSTGANVEPAPEPQVFRAAQYVRLQHVSTAQQLLHVLCHAKMSLAHIVRTPSKALEHNVKPRYTIQCFALQVKLLLLRVTANSSTVKAR